jgi:hypothetical protein
VPGIDADIRSKRIFEGVESIFLVLVTNPSNDLETNIGYVDCFSWPTGDIGEVIVKLIKDIWNDDNGNFGVLQGAF